MSHVYKISINKKLCQYYRNNMPGAVRKYFQYQDHKLTRPEISNSN